MLLSNFWFCELQASKDQTRLDWISSQVQVLSTVYLINTKNLSELQYSTFPLVEFPLEEFTLVEFP